MIMRQIKFRAKTINGGEWVYGDLLQTNEGSVCIGVHGQYIDDGMHFNDMYNKTPYIDEDTIGQFTGLTDSAGKEIYEGDIVKFDCGLEATISYSQIDAAFMFNYRDGLPMPISVMYVISEPALFDAEVISNIHDNPELINQPTAI